MVWRGRYARAEKVHQRLGVLLGLELALHCHGYGHDIFPDSVSASTQINSLLVGRFALESLLAWSGVSPRGKPMCKMSCLCGATSSSAMRHGMHASAQTSRRTRSSARSHGRRPDGGSADAPRLVASPDCADLLLAGGRLRGLVGQRRLCPLAHLAPRESGERVSQSCLRLHLLIACLSAFCYGVAIRRGGVDIWFPRNYAGMSGGNQIGPCEFVGS